MSRVVKPETGEESEGFFDPAGLVLAQVVDPEAAQEIAKVLAGYIP